MSTSTPKIVLGAGSIGASTDAQAHFTNAEDAQAFLNLFRSYGHVDIDTARGYSPGAPGTSEPILGQTDYKQWAVIDTKVTSGSPNAHTKENIAESIQQSLNALKVDKVSESKSAAPVIPSPAANQFNAYAQWPVGTCGISAHTRPYDVLQRDLRSNEHGLRRRQV